MHRTPPTRVAHPTQLVLFRDTGPWWSGSAGDDWWRDPNPTDPGRVVALERLSLCWRVHDMLAADRVRLADAREVALRELALVYASNPATAKKVTTEVVRFLAYVTACGVEYVDELTSEHVDEFVWSAVRSHGRFKDVSATTAANRQSFIRKFFHVLAGLGVWSGGDPVGASIRRDDVAPSRALTDAESRRLHVQVYEGILVGREPLIVALAEAGGDPLEIAMVTPADVDLDAGTVGFRGEAARVNPLAGWSLEAVRVVLDQERLPVDRPMCVTPGLPAHRAAQSITVRLHNALVAAGLHSRDGVTAKSIRITSAAQILNEDGIEAAARFLGNASLDATARMLSHDWWRNQ